MALRSLAAKTRIPAAARLPSAPRVSPASGSRALSSPSSPSSIKNARDWYLIQRARYDDLTRQLTSFRREVVWTERLAKLLDVTCILGISICTVPLVAKGIIIRNMSKGQQPSTA